LPTPHANKPGNNFSHRFEAERACVQLFWLQKENFCNFITGPKHVQVTDLAGKSEIHGMVAQPGVIVDVRHGKKVAKAGNLQADLFPGFSAQSLFSCFMRIDEPSGQVQGALCRIERALGNQQTALWISNQCDHGSRCIKEE
jgi:hypothetical protein